MVVRNLFVCALALLFPVIVLGSNCGDGLFVRGDSLGTSSGPDGFGACYGKEDFKTLQYLVSAANPGFRCDSETVCSAKYGVLLELNSWQQNFHSWSDCIANASMTPGIYYLSQPLIAHYPNNDKTEKQVFEVYGKEWHWYDKFPAMGPTGHLWWGDCGGSVEKIECVDSATNTKGVWNFHSWKWYADNGTNHTQFRYVCEAPRRYEKSEVCVRGEPKNTALGAGGRHGRCYYEEDWLVVGNTPGVSCSSSTTCEAVDGVLVEWRSVKWNSSHPSEDDGSVGECKPWSGGSKELTLGTGCGSTGKKIFCKSGVWKRVSHLHDGGGLQDDTYADRWVCTSQRQQMNLKKQERGAVSSGERGASSVVGVVPREVVLSSGTDVPAVFLG